MTLPKLSSGSPLSFAGLCLEAPKPESRLNRRERRSLAQICYGPVKRVIDVAGALTLAFFLWPVMALIALAIKLSSPGPIVFRQRRLTSAGREFTIYKFRTMYLDAESKTGAVWAKKQDPRVTFVGRFLRNSHLDELPQIVNVLKGDMSLIGPRPERPELVGKLQDELPSFNRRMEVKAGITGLAQTSNGYASCMESYRRKLALDILYVKNRCLWLDLRIAARTVLVVLTGKGGK